MDNSPANKSVPSSESTNHIQQEIGSNQGQTIAQMVGGFAIGQLTVYLSQITQAEPNTTITPSTSLSLNPYKGLEAFQETDSAFFFGREQQIQQLWQKFQDLHRPGEVRLLPIYGPSGSGKSSLARAGFIPQLGWKPLPGYAVARVAVLVPGTHPLEALATMLARIATHDPLPIEKSEEFERVLKRMSDRETYEGLRRITHAFPDIHRSPLIIVVDQFEEVYTLCKDSAECDVFVSNLLCAATDQAGYTSVILTMRSDFLPETQQQPRLNALFSTQGFLVPTMQPEELERAIAQPAIEAGYPLDTATIKLLIAQTQGGKGALPLLQFALMRIWEGLEQGIEPAKTLQQIGGVGGALAGEAQHLYESLNAEDQNLARQIFLNLVKLGEGTEDTRRRTPLSQLITSDRNKLRIQAIIRQFAAPNVRFLSTSSDPQQGEMIEVAHEALIHNWDELKAWVNESRAKLHQKQKIEQSAQEWVNTDRSKDYLLEGRPLRDAKEFIQFSHEAVPLSAIATEFVIASQRKQKRDFIGRITTSLILPVIVLAPAILHFGIILYANQSLRQDDCKLRFETKFLLQYLMLVGQGYQFSDLKLCKQYLSRIDFSGNNIYLSGSDFSGADLSSANFKSAILEKIKFKNSILIGANMKNARVIDTDISGSDLSGAILEDAVIVRANFRDAIINEANMNNTIIINSDLSSVKRLSSDQVHDLKICNSLLPDYIEISSDRDCLSPEVINNHI